MDKEKTRSTILDLLDSIAPPNRCFTCYGAGVRCQFKVFSGIRMVSIDHRNEFPLPSDKFDCKFGENPDPTPEEIEGNAQSLKILEKELAKITPKH